MKAKKANSLLVKSLCAVAIVAIFMGIFLKVSASQAGSDDYQALVKLNQEFLAFSKPKSIDGIPDYREDAIKAWRQGLNDFRQRLDAIDPKAWPVPQKVDYLMVRTRLNVLDFRLRVLRPWERDPSLYVDMIAGIPFTLGEGKLHPWKYTEIGLPLKEEALIDFKKRLEAVPKIFAQAKNTLTGASKELADIAIRTLERYEGTSQGEPLRDVPPEGVLGWYSDLVERLSKYQPELVDDARQALKSAENFRDWLKQNAGKMTAPVYIGIANYNWYIKNVLLMPYTVEDILRLSEQEWYRIITFLKIEQDNNKNLPQLKPATTGAEYERSLREGDALLRSFIKKRKLMTIPDWTPPQYDTDAFWRSVKGGHRHFWEEIAYRDPLMNYIHASFPGHRWDEEMLEKHAKHPIRIPYEDLGRRQGWGVYCEEMLLQAGLLKDRPRARELFYIAQLKRVLRIPVEVKMMTGEFTLEQAIQFMIKEIPFMEEDLAYYDLHGYLRSPTNGMSYSMGKLEFMRLLTDRARQLGDKFDLGKFHDEFLAFDHIPLSLIRWEMTGLDDEVKKFW